MGGVALLAGFVAPRYRTPGVRAGIQRPPSGVDDRLVGADEPAGVASLQEIAVRGRACVVGRDLNAGARARRGRGGNRHHAPEGLAPAASTEPHRVDVLRAEWPVGGGVEALKLYVMVGLPTETEQDVDAIADLVRAVRARLMSGGRPKVGRILVSLNPFVPKPWTPFQWEPMEDLGSLKRKLARVRRQLTAVPAVQVETESPREGYLQTMLSRGDRRVAPVLERLHADPESWWPTLRTLRGGVHDIVDPDRFVHRPYAPDELLPWDFIDHAVDKRYLLAERRKAHGEIQTPPCDTHTCHSCGAC
jgi:hypothetical protein